MTIDGPNRPQTGETSNVSNQSEVRSDGKVTAGTITIEGKEYRVVLKGAKGPLSNEAISKVHEFVHHALDAANIDKSQDLSGTVFKEKTITVKGQNSPLPERTQQEFHTLFDQYVNRTIPPSDPFVGTPSGEVHITLDEELEASAQQVMNQLGIEGLVLEAVDDGEATATTPSPLTKQEIHEKKFQEFRELLHRAGEGRLTVRDDHLVHLTEKRRRWQPDTGVSRKAIDFAQEQMSAAILDGAADAAISLLEDMAKDPNIYETNEARTEFHQVVEQLANEDTDRKQVLTTEQRDRIWAAGNQVALRQIPEGVTVNDGVCSWTGEELPTDAEHKSAVIEYKSFAGAKYARSRPVDTKTKLVTAQGEMKAIHDTLRAKMEGNEEAFDAAIDVMTSAETTFREAATPADRFAAGDALAKAQSALARIVVFHSKPKKEQEYERLLAAVEAGLTDEQKAEIATKEEELRHLTTEIKELRAQKEAETDEGKKNELKESFDIKVDRRKELKDGIEEIQTAAEKALDSFQDDLDFNVQAYADANTKVRGLSDSLTRAVKVQKHIETNGGSRFGVEMRREHPEILETEDRARDVVLQTIAQSGASDVKRIVPRIIEQTSSGEARDSLQGRLEELQQEISKREKACYERQNMMLEGALDPDKDFSIPDELKMAEFAGKPARLLAIEVLPDFVGPVHKEYILPYLETIGSLEGRKADMTFTIDGGNKASQDAIADQFAAVRECYNARGEKALKYLQETEKLLDMISGLAGNTSRTLGP